jgi:FkbM family methyltransferase
MKIPAALKPTLTRLVKGLFPRLFWRHRYRRIAKVAYDDELTLVPHLCNSSKTSVDVGAANGFYSVRMLSASRDVIAFEPRLNAANELAAMFASVGAPARVETVCLSDHAGNACMRMLVEDLGRSTIEVSNTLEDEDGSAQAQIMVQTRRLDDYSLDGVGFIKVDVEGHELAVMHGARATLERNRPVLLIESEDRHRKNSVINLTAFLQGLGYIGFFLLDRVLHPMSEFDPARYQEKSNIGSWKSGWERRGFYVNNFFFVPKERKDDLMAAVRTQSWSVSASRG